MSVRFTNSRQDKGKSMKRYQFRVGAVSSACIAALLVASGCGSSGGGGEAASTTQAASQGSSTSPSGGGGGTVHLGLIADLTGAGAEYAVPFADAAKVAVDNINAAGGINGTKVDLTTEDDQTTAATGISDLTTLTNVDHIHLVMCICASSILIPVVDRAKSTSDVTIVNAAAGSSSIRQLPPIVVTTLPLDDVLAQALAKMAWGRGVRKAYIIGQNDAYGTDLNTQLQKAWKALGGTVAGDAIVDPSLTDYTSEMRIINNTHPDAVLSGTYGPDAALQFKEITALGSKAPWYNLYAEYSDQVALPGSTNRVYGLEPGWSASNNPTVAAQLAKATTKYPVGYYSASGYDTTELSAMALATRTAQTVPATREAFVASGKAYTGSLTGPVQFDAQYARINALYSETVAQNGKLVPLSS
jgi:ABC-type branched-subunit amino acid transport system substrate-binding protein